MSKSFFTVLACTILVICPAVLEAQEYYEAPESKFAKFTRLLGPEKLYIHTDKDRYCVGDTIWLKGYLANASLSADYPTCNYIYVELIAADKISETARHGQEKVVERIKLRKTGGQFFGHLVIPDNLFDGIASLRAYSYWMINKGEDFFFQKDIHIASWYKEGISWIKKKKKPDDVQFLPESGRYHPDEESCFGIRAIGEDGRGVSSTGNIFADKDSIGRYVTDDHGFGKIALTVPEGVQGLYAVSDKGIRYNIPLPEKDVVVINVGNDSSSFSVRVHGETAKKTWILAYNKTAVLKKIRCPFRDTTVSIEYSDLTPGVNRIAVVNDSSAVLAERTVFVFDDKPAASTMNLSFDPKTGHSLGISLNDAYGKPLRGSFSVSVVDAKNYYNPHGSSIESHMYLESEFGEVISDSRRFFVDSIPIEERRRSVDAVMMTYGWEYYNLSQILTYTSPMPSFGKEYAQSLTGRLSGYLKKRDRRTQISIIAPTILYASIDNMDGLGGFAKNGLNFPENTGFIISTTNRYGNAARMPIMNEDFFPKVKHIRHYTVLDTSQTFDMTVHAQMIQPSEIVSSSLRAYKGLSPFGEENFKKYQLREGKELRPYDGYDIPDYVIRAFPGTRLEQGIWGAIIQTRVPFSSSGMQQSSHWLPVMIYIDAMRADPVALNQLRISDVEAIALLSGMDSYAYTDIFTSASVLMVKTIPIKRTPTNTAVVSPKGWQKPVKRYVPKYRPSADYIVTDGTICWEPNLSLVDGKATVPISQTSSPDIHIRIEGIAAGGKPVSFEKKMMLVEAENND